MAGFSSTPDILPQEADHDYNLRCANADALRSVWTELKSTVESSSCLLDITLNKPHLHKRILHPLDT